MIDINRFQNSPLRPDQINDNEDLANPNRHLSDVEFLLTMLREGGPTDKPPLNDNQLGKPEAFNKTSLPLVNEVTKQDHAQLIKLIEAEKLRSTGAASATEELLGLNQKPSILGALVPPPGNSIALRYMTPVMRRTTIRELLSKQRKRIRNLAHLLHSESEENNQKDQNNHNKSSEEFVVEETNFIENCKKRAVGELNHTVQMLNLLSDLLAMQDQALSQMGSFSKG